MRRQNETMRARRHLCGDSTDRNAGAWGLHLRLPLRRALSFKARSAVRDGAITSGGEHTSACLKLRQTQTDQCECAT